MIRRYPVLAASLFLALAPHAEAQERDAKGPCEYHDPGTASLPLRDGYAAFLAEDDLKPFKDALPHVERAEVEALLRAADTMWYDEDSMVFAYQDSVETVTGARANCVGRKVGERATDPGIKKLLNYFGPDFRFKYPFRTAAGTDNATNVKALQFWAPPKQAGRTMPVKYWRESSRGRWHWVFPVGTVFGEVLYEQGPDQRWVVYEIRTRKRYRDGWAPDIFRPFATATGLAETIKAKRPAWAQDSNLAAFVGQLLTPTNLVAHRVTSEAYGAIFPPIDGALDLLPELQDKALLTELLTTTTFRSVEGAIWKANGRLETYAPASKAEFGIVPKGYEMGMIPVNEVSCNRCHTETGHPLRDFDYQVVLYGEMWGEDRIFTWHLFEPHSFIYDTWDDADNSRKVSVRLTAANLLKEERVGPNDPSYKRLPEPFDPPEK